MLKKKRISGTAHNFEVSNAFRITISVALCSVALEDIA